MEAFFETLLPIIPCVSSVSSTPPAERFASTGLARPWRVERPRARRAEPRCALRAGASRSVTCRALGEGATLVQVSRALFMAFVAAKPRTLQIYLHKAIARLWRVAHFTLTDFLSLSLEQFPAGDARGGAGAGARGGAAHGPLVGALLAPAPAEPDCPAHAEANSSGGSGGEAAAHGRVAIAGSGGSGGAARFQPRLAIVSEASLASEASEASGPSGGGATPGGDAGRALESPFQRVAMLVRAASGSSEGSSVGEAFALLQELEAGGDAAAAAQRLGARIGAGGGAAARLGAAAAALAASGGRCVACNARSMPSPGGWRCAHQAATLSAPHRRPHGRQGL